MPIRFVYFKGKLIDLGSGLDITLVIIPSVSSNSGGVSLDDVGALAYLSPKVSKSLFAQLYFMKDPLNEYSTLKLAHSEPDPFVEALNQQGANLGDFVYYFGFRGPLEIWDTRTIPDNILTRDEFLRARGDYAEFDNLQFTK